MSRTILHLDADAFFASVEQATDARLRGKPVAVGGEKRGIIASASYEARQFGIYTPMPTVQARRLCPRLILLPGDFDKYELFSRLMFSYAYDFTPDVEIGSIDEGYFDLTGSRKPPLNIAETIRRAIRQSLKLSVSEGVGSNKLISQIASKLKKPDAFQWVPPGQEAPFLSPLANKWLPGVGPHLANQFNAAGLARIGQIARTPADLLGLLAGSMAPQLSRFARGLDERPVVPVREPAKSFGEQETFAADTTDEPFLQATLRRMADKLMAKVREEGKSIRTLTVKVRYNDMDEDQAAESVAEPTDLETEVYSTLALLLRKAWKRRVSLRLVSLKLSNLYDGRFHSGLALDVSARHHDSQQRLADIVDELRHKYGRSVVLRGHDFILRNKRERGQEPGFQVGRAVPGAPSLNHQLKETPPPYSLAVVQRQRLGKYARQPPGGKARKLIHTSPGPELRFRVIKTGHAVPGAPPTADQPKELSRLPGTASPASARPPKRRTGYVPLNVHSCFSFLDSTLSIQAVVDLAKRHDLPAIALTDKNNLHGAVEFAQAAAKAGIKPIIGAELEWNGHRLCLYVQNQKGYHNLCRILTARHEQDPAQSSEFDARCSLFGNSDPSLPIGLGEGSGMREGLLAVSPAAELAPFFPDHFYLAVSDLESFNKRSNSLPAVASFPIHYEQPSDRWKYDVVQSIRTLTLLRQPHPQKRLEGEYHFRTPVGMQKLFAAHPELIAHSFELADRCSFEFNLGTPQFPGYTPADGSLPSAFLRRLAMEGLQRRYPKEHARLKPQLEQELAIITDVGYEEYFLVMWDILQDCRRRGIEWITRGSAADSLACYCLGISSVCPIRFDLYFRRFLNKDRMALNKLPDIDVDFPHDRKDDVIDLIFAKYGSAHTAVVGGFSTFQSRSAFAEVAKVLGVSEYQVRRITERLPHYSRATELAEAVATTQECRDLPFEEEPYRSALHMAQFLDG
ncbi:MAG TPA: PHP domain-containing protein, partial [Methylomirabilota bacterium]|nr:PHP domain-containing protein [Methylomirabilota bacterium]